MLCRRQEETRDGLLAGNKYINAVHGPDRKNSLAEMSKMEPETPIGPDGLRIKCHSRYGLLHSFKKLRGFLLALSFESLPNGIPSAARPIS